MAKTINLKTELKGAGLVDDDFTEEVLADMRNFAATIAAAAYAQGVKLAQEKLDSTAQDYIRNFTLTSNDDTHTLSLAPPAHHLEDGYGSFDMKPGLLNGPNAKEGKNGKYNVVPFRIKTEPAATNLAEQLLGQELKTGLKKYGEDVFGNRADLSKTQKYPSGSAMEGKVGRISSNAPVHRYLKGAMKIQNVYDNATQSMYLSMRTVSSNSPSNAWVHPGFGGIHVFEDLGEWVENQVDEFIGKHAI